MAAMKSFHLLLYLSSITNIACFSIPLLTWEVGRSKHEDPTLAGHTVDITKVFNKYLDPIIKRNDYTFVFLQDELSVDDFVKYASSFKYMQKFNEIQKPFVLPAVNSKESDIDSVIRAHAPGKVADVYNEYLAEWKFDENLKFVFFYLEPIGGTSLDGKKAVLERNDRLFHETLKKIEKKIDTFAIIYTSKFPTENVAHLLATEQASQDSMLKRHLLAVEDSGSVTNIGNGKLFNNTGCILMYLTSIKFGNSNVNATELINASWKVSESSCDGNKLYSMTINTDKEIGDVKKFSMRIDVEMSKDYQEWYCKDITLNGIFKKDNFNATVPCGGHFNPNFKGFPLEKNPSIIVPTNLCYSCYGLDFKMSSNYQLKLGGLQMQPKTASIAQLNKFTGAYNCQGFFTIEILTGIFVTLILVVGLFFGIMMIMAIQTPELFDDPKGQTISVNVQE